MRMTNIQKTKTDKNMMVEFSHLNDNNKTEFLEFLLMNNITFERTNANGKNDYVAKVVVPKLDNKTQRHSVNRNNKENIDQGLIGKNANKGIKGNAKVYVGHQNSELSLSPLNQNIDSFRLTTPRKNNNQIQNKNLSTSIPKQIIKNETSPIHKKYSANKTMGKNESELIMKKEKIKNMKNQEMIRINTTEFLNYDDSVIQIRKPKQNQGCAYKVNTKEKSRYEKNNETGLKKNDTNVMNMTRNECGKDLTMNKSKEIKKNGKKCELNSSIMTFTNIEECLEVSLSREKERGGMKVNKNINLKEKTEKQKEINELVNKYLKLFDMKLNGQRPIKWSFCQLIKAIEEIYNELFIKNTQILARKLGTQQYANNFIKFIKEFFMNKYKNEKLMNSNIINMLYSLSFYLEDEKLTKGINYSVNTHKNEMANYVKEVKAHESMTSSGYFLQNFEDFVCEIYQFEELLYYLFIRSIIIAEGSKLQIKQTLNKNQILIGETCLTFIEIENILCEILGKDVDLIEEYKSIIKMHVDSNSFLGSEKEIKMTVAELMALLVEDYRTKRLIMQEERHINRVDGVENEYEDTVECNKIDKNKNGNKIKNIGLQNNNCFNINQGETDELTFGEETQENISLFLEQHKSMESLYGHSNGNVFEEFWHINEEMLDEGNGYNVNSLEYLMIEKMKKKVYEFFNILMENRSEYNSGNANNFHRGEGQNLGNMAENNLIVLSLFMHKSLNLLSSIINMNKIEWFEELKVNDPSQEDFDKIEELQLLFKKLKIKPEAEGIGWLCKSILTVTQLVSNLEKLMESML